MEETYNTNSFNVFMVAMTSIFLFFDAIYLIWKYRSVRRERQERKEYMMKHRDGKIDRDMQNKVIGFTTTYYVCLALFFIGLFALMYFYENTSVQETEVFDPYEILGIPIGSTDKEIKRAYRKLALKYHPDKATGSEEMFQQVERAYETLTNELARYNWETYGNPDGPTTVTHGIGLPAWMSEKKGQIFFLILYFALFLVAIPFVVKYFKKKSDSKLSSSKREVVCKDTVGIYYSFMSKNLLVSSLPEFFSCAKEFDNFMTHDEEIDTLLRRYYNAMSRSSDQVGSYSVARMKKPRVPLERLDTNEEHASNLRVAIILYAYLAGLEIDERLKPYLNAILGKCEMFFDGLIQASLYPLKGEKYIDKDRINTVIRFIQLVYQGRFYKDSSLRQLPYFTDAIIKGIKNNSSDSDLKNYIKTEPSKRKGMNRFTPEQVVEVNKAIANIPFLDIEASLEVEDETSIGVGDMMTLVLKITRKNIPLSTAAAPTEEEDQKEEEPHYEGEIDLANATTLDKDDETSEDIYDYVNGLPEEEITCLPVYSKKYFYVLVCDEKDNEVLVFITPNGQLVPAFSTIEDQHRTFEDRSIHIPAFREGRITYTVHVYSANYIGMDYTLPVSCNIVSREKIEKEQEKIRQRDEEDIRKEGKGFMSSLLNQDEEEEEEDDGWDSDDEEEEKPKKAETKAAEATKKVGESRRERKNEMLRLKRLQAKMAKAASAEPKEPEETVEPKEPVDSEISN